MKQNILETLEKEFESITRKYINLFCEKQGLQFLSWSDDIGENAVFSNHYCFSFMDIRFDLLEDVPKGVILEWHNETNISYGKQFEMYIDEPNLIDFVSYSMGRRYIDK